MENVFFSGLLTIFGILAAVYSQAFKFALVFALLYLIVIGPKKLFKISPKALIGSAHNLGLLLFNSFIFVFVFGGGTFLSNKAYETYGLPHLESAFWEALPLWGVYFAVFILLDFSNFVRHKILHSKWLWGLHALHHSDEHLTWTTTYRVHFLEVIVSKTVGLALIGALFLPVEIVATVAAIRSFYSCFIHCQNGISYGWFDRVLSSPNYHYWHHADVPEAYGKNLALMFPIWDIIFGSYYNPKICTEKTGVKEVPSDFMSGQLYPIKYVIAALSRQSETAKPKPQST